MEKETAKKTTKSRQRVKPQARECVAEYELINQCLVIKLNKELDHHSSLIIREKTDKLIDRGTVKNIIFDFEGANFMDSSGIGVIMGRYKRVLFTGGKVAVTNVSDTIDRILKLSGLYKIIEKHASNKEAMSSLTG